MRTMWLFLLGAAAAGAVPVTAVPPVAAQVSGAAAEQAAAAFLQAFVSGDGTRMKEQPQDGEVVTFVKAGDFVDDLHFRNADY